MHAETRMPTHGYRCNNDCRLAEVDLFGMILDLPEHLLAVVTYHRFQAKLLSTIVTRNCPSLVCSDKVSCDWYVADIEVEYEPPHPLILHNSLSDTCRCT